MWKELLKEKGFLVSDGAWGTELAKGGLEPGAAPELLNVERPEVVLAVASSYVEAGSEIILTNTFGANRLKLAHSGLADRTKELNARGAEISLKAAKGRALVFASVGPTGEFLEPLGSLAEPQMVECFAEQIAALAEAGADGIVIESMSAVDEGAAALKAARGVCKLPVVISMTFEKGMTGYATMMGTRPEVAARSFDAADIVGANCGSGIANMVAVARLMRSSTRKPLWIKSNAGLPELVGGKTVFHESPDEMAARLGDLVKAGANIIGGCCGTTPDHIRAIVRARTALARSARATLSKQLEL